MPNKDRRCQEGKKKGQRRRMKVAAGRTPLSRVSSRLVSPFFPPFHHSSSIFWGAFARLFHAPFFYRLSKWPLSLVDPIWLKTYQTLNPSHKPSIDNNQETTQMHVPLHITSAFFFPLTGLPVVI
jgi:hypothetical protein